MGRPRKAKVSLPPHVHTVKSRGRFYYYFHAYRGTNKDAGRTRLPGTPFDSDGTPAKAWWDAYRSLTGTDHSRLRAGSFAALIQAFKNSPEWSGLGERTKDEWSRHLARVKAAWGELLVEGLEAKHILALRDKFAASPASANNLLRALSSMMSWSVPRGWRSDNPCAHVRKFKSGDGYRPWNWEEIEYFRVSARQDLWMAAALALYTGQRQSDVLAMRWSDVRDGLIAVTQAKTGKKLWIPLHGNLTAAIGEIHRDSVHILTSSKRTPWTSDGFKSSWNAEFKRPKMQSLRDGGCVFHGLRKSAVVFLLEAGCSDAEVSSITGQSRQMVEHYARQVNQRKLAASAVLKWEAAEART